MSELDSKYEPPEHDPCVAEEDQHPALNYCEACGRRKYADLYSELCLKCHREERRSIE